MRSIVSGLFAAMLMAGCASYNGAGLVPGKSTAAEVETVMGRPADRVTKPDGGAVLYYPRGPEARDTFAASIGADGKLQAIDQILTDANIAKIVPGSTTAAQVRDLIGPSVVHSSLPRIGRDVWEYKIGDEVHPFLLYVQLSSDGIVREVVRTRDPHYDMGDGGSLP